jgi:hypothetical protein
MSMVKLFRVIAIVFVITAALAGCVSRYRMEMYMVINNEQKKLKIDQTEYARDVVIGNPYADHKLLPGEDNCIILRTGTRGESYSTDMTQSLFIGTDEYLRTLVYLEVPGLPSADTIKLTDKNSFVQILGRYEQPTEQKIFLPTSGQLVIDSLSGNRMFCTLDGSYANREGNPLTYQGRFKVKIAY